MSAEMQRRRWQFTGTVQGVGFRYRAQYAASLLGLTGWVENNWDGSVTLEAQGTPENLDRLVPTITKTSQWIHIESFRCTPQPVIANERSFRVRY
ncbi:MAG: acylphosphatase [Oscillospiraceae bacterium]|nr:acylphosphatase [Oscillospiraceae bacterium]